MRICVGILCSCLVLSGCANNRYITPVTNFRTSTTQSVSIINDFYSTRNSFEAQIYLSDKALDPSQKVELKDASGNPTPLLQPTFSPASIKARLDALQVISVYASRLYDLVNTSAPADFTSSTAALGTSLSKLGDTFSQLVGTPREIGTAQNYVGPISTVIGVIGKMYLGKKRDEMVQAAIIDGGPAVNQILLLIQQDLDKVFSSEVSTAAYQTLASDIDLYNKRRLDPNLKYEDRVALLNKIGADASGVASLSTAVPSQLVQSMLTANSALIESAKAKNKSDKQFHLAQLNDALTAWVSQIQQLSTQIKTIIK